MIEVNRAILHILDLKSGVPVLSDKELDPDVFEYLQKHLEKAWLDAGVHVSHIGEVNPVRKAIGTYLSDEEQLAKITQEWAEKLHKDLMDCGEEKPVDLVCVDFSVEGARQFGLVIYPNQMGYLHKVAYDGEDVRNEIIEHYAILPNTTQKISMFAFVDVEDWSVKFADKKRELDGEKVFLLPDRLLNCTMPNSQKETIKQVHKIVNKVAEEFGQNTAQAVSRAKTFVMQQSEEKKEFAPAELGQVVFENNPGMQQSYNEQVAMSSLPERAKMDPDFALKTNKTHKIKTDNGIEIIIPSSYVNNPNYIEFISNENGTISIELKNIGEILNK